MAKSMAYYCPHMNACQIYENTLGEESEERLDIILSHDGVLLECLALNAYNDPASPHGRSSIDTVLGCSHLELLNRTGEI